MAVGLMGLLASTTPPTFDWTARAGPPLLAAPVEPRRLGLDAPAGIHRPGSTEVPDGPIACAGTRPASDRPRRPAAWMRRVEGLVAGRSVSVAVGVEGSLVYGYRDRVRRPPASNQKLLLSMAVLDELGPSFRIRTFAAADGSIADGVIHGDLWILGRGDPEVDGGRLRVLADRVVASGIREVRGSVLGDTAFFRRGWWAPGWKPFHPGTYIALPTALTFDGNRASSDSVRDPERRAAAALTAELEARGVRVREAPGAGRAPGRLVRVASVRSPRLAVVLEHQNVVSSNFHAEVLTKLLGRRSSGTPGTLAAGAAAIKGWALERGARIVAHDGSGLSYANRVSAGALVGLLLEAEGEDWGTALRRSLPRPGQGTLRGRLAGLRVRAKTGTITIASALSGWAWLRRAGAWAAFSILSTGLPKREAASLEEAILRIVVARASPQPPRSPHGEGFGCVGGSRGGVG